MTRYDMGGVSAYITRRGFKFEANVYVGSRHVLFNVYPDRYGERNVLQIALGDALAATRDDVAQLERVIEAQPASTD